MISFNVFYVMIFPLLNGFGNTLPLGANFVTICPENMFDTR